MTAGAAYALERLQQAMARVGLSRSEIYRRIAAGDFAKPVKLGERDSAWNAAEVDRWIADRIAARDAKAAACTGPRTTPKLRTTWAWKGIRGRHERRRAARGKRE